MTITGASTEVMEIREDDADTELKNLPGVTNDERRPSPPTQSPTSRLTPEPPPPPPPPPSPHSSAAPAAPADPEQVKEAREPLLETGTGSQGSFPDVTQTEAEGPETEEEEDGVPYDRGWAWMVAFGLFVNYSFIAGFTKASGLIFVELLRKFHAPVTHTALLFAIRAGVFSFSGFYVMNILLGQFGSRKLALIGAVLVSLSAILSSFAHNLTLLICVHSVLLGVGMALLCSPGEVLVGRYFRKRRSLALGLAKCGASIGNVAVPPLLTYLLAEYGLMGTLLLYGGMCLHCLPAALLFRPTSYFSKRRPVPSSGSSGPESCDTGQSARLPSTRTDKATQRTFRRDSDGSEVVRLTGVESERVLSTFRVVEIIVPDEFAEGDTSRGQRPEFLRSKSHEIVSIEECDASALAQSHPELGMLSAAGPSTLRKRSVSETATSKFSTQRQSREQTVSDLLQAISQSSVVRYMSMSSLDGISSSWILHPPTKDANRHPGSEDDVDNPTCSCVSQALKRVLQCPRNFILLLDFSLFREPLFLLLLAYIVFYPFVNMTLDYLPAMAVENGVPESQSAVLLSVIGGLDFFGRLTSGFIADLKVVRVSTMIAVSFVILGVVLQFVRFMSEFSHFAALAAVQGVFGGVANCLFAVLVIEFVGLDNMGKGIGFCLLACGVSMAAAYPFLGYIRDLTDSYAMTYHVIGLCLLVAAGLASAEGPVRRLHERRQRQRGPQGDCMKGDKDRGPHKETSGNEQRQRGP